MRMLLRRSWGVALMVAMHVSAIPAIAGAGEPPPENVRGFVKAHCVRCHGEKKVQGDVDLEVLLADGSDTLRHFKEWKSAAGRVAAGEMPPAGEKQPTAQERAAFAKWPKSLIADLPAKPGPVQIRRLSIPEYKRTTESLFGFGLTLTTAKAEQTKVETSLIRNLLPPDPPGPSGYTNDTGGNPITTKSLESYAYIADVAITRLLGPDGREAMEAYTGPVGEGGLTPQHAAKLLDTFQTRAWRRPAIADDRKAHAELVRGLSGDKLNAVVKGELKYILMSPEFIYRGVLAKRVAGESGPVDDFELAERLSYFLWADMPDDELIAAAAAGTLSQPKVMEGQVRRMLRSPKARSLSEVFGVQWLQLDELDNVNREVPYAAALKGQPVEFLHDLITRNRPLRELLDSRTEFVNAYLAYYYVPDLDQFPKATRRPGVELEILPLTRIELRGTQERGGLLTMPGILAMNKGPIQRGKWVLERILGEHLGEPPPNVPPIKPTKGGAKSFREQFAAHRANKACASCHDRIDPVGFAFEVYNDGGGFRLASNVAAQKVGKAIPKPMAVKRVEDPNVDASGVLASGERFKDFEEFRTLLLTKLWPRVVENLVRQTLAYALCRELDVGDEKVVADLTARLSKPGATWGDLIDGVVTSVPFREASHPLPEVTPKPR
ncbi:MAG: hypothetical protein C0467_30970 [Planctomycetaceae bacterium]|nr:hypothetical protein [Planctomycetaceae bacterium]